MKNLLKLSTLTLLALSLAGLPLVTSAQTNAPTTEKKSKSGKKDAPKGHAIHGKLVSIDKTEKSITVGKSTYMVTSDTKITKDGKAATLEDGVVGEECGGYVRTNSVGKVVLSTLRFGAKPDSEKKPGKSDSSTQK